jgi:hypothetical protein
LDTTASGSCSTLALLLLLLARVAPVLALVYAELIAVLRLAASVMSLLMAESDVALFSMLASKPTAAAAALVGLLASAAAGSANAGPVSKGA